MAIQGVHGAFHDIAAREYFKGSNLEIIACLTFEDLFALLEKGGCDYGMVAVENSVAGILSHNYFLLNEYSMQIVGEHYLRIVQNLMALPGSSIEDIKEVRSHPIALRQCHLYLNTLRERGVKMVESEDTALAAKRIAQDSLKGIAAIAGELAAKIYGLDIIKAGIESNSRNFTRFLIIGDPWTADEHLKGKTVDKSSMVFALPHEEGSLAKVLSILSYYHINLTKIQSLPIIGREWEYLFYVNLTFDNYLSYSQSLDAIRPFTKDLRILGEYAGSKEQ